ncbi:hypothetical protein Tco_0886210 [Tanacetum coccineum]
MLPSLVDDHLNSRNVSSFEEPVFNSGLKDVAYTTVASVDHKDGIVGRSCNSGSGPDKDVDVNSVTERQMLNLCYEMSYVCVNTSNHANDKESHSQNGYSADHNDIYNYALAASKKSACTNFISSDTFQSLAISYRMCRSSKSFYNEEIVEHQRQLDGGSPINDNEHSTTVKSSKISNILSMDFDGCDDDSVLPQTVVGLYEGNNEWGGPFWNSQNSVCSRFLFANEHSHDNQEFDKFSMFQDFREN